MVPHPPTDVCWYIWTICSYLTLTITIDNYNRQDCCWWSPVSQWLFQTKLNLVWNFHEVDNGHQFFPNQSEFGLESASCKIPFFLSKPNWNWFGKSDAFFGCIFSKPNWIWFGKGHWMKSSCNAMVSSGAPCSTANMCFHDFCLSSSFYPENMAFKFLTLGMAPLRTFLPHSLAGSWHLRYSWYPSLRELSPSEHSGVSSS